MNPERWQEIERLYQAALERAAAERSPFLERACAGDEELGREVARLVESHESQDSFLQTAAFDLGLELLANEETESLAGQSIGPYRLLSFLGSGGMGQVYLAQDTRLGRKVAVKLLPTSVTANHERVQRFRQEARAASTISHPSVAHVYEVGEAEGRQYIAMEFVEGMTLRERLSQSGRLAPPEAVGLAVQVAAALSAAHAAGILHRDIKPENIMLGRDGGVKVLDFGLAKLTTRQTPRDEHPSRQTIAGPQATNVFHTEPGLLLGTAQYMSPEQARGEDTDARSDIWSLGVVLYEMLAGRTPFEGRTNIDVIAEILKSNPPPLSQYLPGVSPALESMLAKMLAKDAGERYQSLLDVLPELRRLLQESGFEDTSKQAGQSESNRESADAARQAKASVAARSSFYSSGLAMVKDKARHPRLLAAVFVTTLVAALGSVFAFNYLTSADEAAAHFGIGYDLEKQKRFVEAEAAYRKAAELKPDSALYHSGVGYALGNQGKYAEAENYYRNAVRLEPTSALYHAGLGWVLGELGKLDEAESELRQAMQLDQDPGNVTYQRLLKRIRQLGANPPDAGQSQNASSAEEAAQYFKSGFALEAQRKYVEAGAKYQQAVEHEPNNAVYHAALAWSLFNQGKYVNAESAYRAAVQLEPTNAGYHFGVGQALEFQRRHHEAIAAYQKAVELEPANGFYHSGAAYVLANLMEFAESEIYYRNAMRGEPDSLNILIGFGWVLEQQGKYAEAEREVRKALRIDANSPIAAKLLNRILETRRTGVRRKQSPESGNPWR